MEESKRQFTTNLECSFDNYLDNELQFINNLKHSFDDYIDFPHSLLESQITVCEAVTIMLRKCGTFKTEWLIFLGIWVYRCIVQEVLL